VVDIFALNEERAAASNARPAPAKASASQAAKPTGVRALQDRVKTAAQSYLSHGNAAVKDDWSEF
jgi:methyl-accepting chemotaxis protein